MRRVFLAAGSLIALLSFASTANASATIELLWGGVASEVTIATSSSVSLQIIYTNDQDSIGAVVSVDYSAAIGSYSVIGFTNNPNAGTTTFLPLVLG